MSKIAIVFHSGYGHTAKISNAVKDGAMRVPGTTVDLVKVEEIEQNWDKLNAADAIIFGAPTYMASASAPFKAFMDASSKFWAKQAWKDKIAAGFTNSSSQSGDKLSTLMRDYQKLLNGETPMGDLDDFMDYITRRNVHVGMMTVATKLPQYKELVSLVNEELADRAFAQQAKEFMLRNQPTAPTKIIKARFVPVLHARTCNA